MSSPDRLEAAEAFVNHWSSLLISLPDDYACHMTCIEADLAAELLQAFGMMQAAEALLGAHAEHDEEGDLHFPEVGPSEQP